MADPKQIEFLNFENTALQLVEHDECRALDRFAIDPIEMICAGHETNAACKGDSVALVCIVTVSRFYVELFHLAKYVTRLAVSLSLLKVYDTNHF